MHEMQIFDHGYTDTDWTIKTVVNFFENLKSEGLDQTSTQKMVLNRIKGHEPA